MLEDYMNFLFLCTGNSCRSIMAEAIFRHLAPSEFSVQSAGSHPTGFVHPKAIETLKKHGISTDNLTSKSWDNLNPIPQVVITLCSSAQGETCPSYIGQVVRSHWGMQDPAHAKDLDIAFAQTYETLQARIQKFLSLPLNDAEREQEKLKYHLDSIINS